MTDLLPIPESLSPKLRWLREHGLRTNLDPLPRTYIGPLNSQPWVCSNIARTLCAFGEDEAEAILNYCHNSGLKHWEVAEYERQAAARRVVEDEADSPCIICGAPEPCSHDFDKQNRQLEDIGRSMGSALPEVRVVED